MPGPTGRAFHMNITGPEGRVCQRRFPAPLLLNVKHHCPRLGLLERYVCDNPPPSEPGAIHPHSAQRELTLVPEEFHVAVHIQDVSTARHMVEVNHCGRTFTHTIGMR